MNSCLKSEYFVDGLLRWNYVYLYRNYLHQVVLTPFRYETA